MMRVPVFHVNGEDPEAVTWVARLAADYRQRFKQDVVIDMYCYRKWGHNEGDEPRFTQPRMYALIDKKPSIREIYEKRLVESGKVTREQAENIATQRKAALAAELTEARSGDYLQPPRAMEGIWSPYKGGPDKLVPEQSDTTVPFSRTASSRSSTRWRPSRRASPSTRRCSRCSSTTGATRRRPASSTGAGASTSRSRRSSPKGTSCA